MIDLCSADFKDIPLDDEIPNDLVENDAALKLLEDWTESAWTYREESLGFIDSQSYELKDYYVKKSRVDIERVEDKVYDLSPEEFYGKDLSEIYFL